MNYKFHIHIYIKKQNLSDFLSFESFPSDINSIKKQSKIKGNWKNHNTRGSTYKSEKQTNLSIRWYSHIRLKDRIYFFLPFQREQNENENKNRLQETAIFLTSNFQLNYFWESIKVKQNWH